MFSRQVRRMSVFRRIKQTKTNSLVVQFDFGFPSVVFFTYACVTRLVVAALSILRVLCVCSFSQVAQTVVRTILIDVIKLLRRPRAVRVQPRQPMRGVQHVVYANANVAVAHSASGRVAGAAPPSGFVPCEFARIGIVVDQFTESCLGKRFGAHGLNNIKQAGNCQA